MFISTFTRQLNTTRFLSANQWSKTNPISWVTDIFKNNDADQFSKDQVFFTQGKSKTHFDYLIVGGGSAGAVLAWRLLKDGANTVGIIEKGSLKPKLWSRIPLGLGFAVQSTRYSDHYYTTPQKNLNNRQIFWPRGHGLGGSSNINGMVFVRGHPEDYNKWEELGAKGWSYENVLPYFKKSETCKYGSSQYRGDHGPMKLSRRMDGFCSELTDTFLRAGTEAGYPLSDDFSGANREGFGYYDLSIHNGKRQSSAEAYIPYEYHLEFYKQLRIISNTQASNIIFDNNKAVGVNCNGKKYYASKEVILASGSLETPILLMKSGIGDENELKDEGISVKQHLPGVGKNLQDHLEIYLQAKTNHTTLYEFNKSMVSKGLGMYYWYLHGEGPLNSSHLDSGSFLKSNESITNPDVQMHFFPFLVMDHGKNIPNFNAFQVHAGTMRPKSVGSLQLKSGKMIIEPNYMSEQADMDNMIDCVKITQHLLEQPSFKNVITKVLTDCSDVVKFIKNNAETAYHPCGTAKMGNLEKDNMAVLDSQMKVAGIQNLRVVDASAMPSMISANLNATVIMMAEKAADMILQENQKKSNQQVGNSNVNL